MSAASSIAWCAVFPITGTAEVTAPTIRIGTDTILVA